MSKTLHMQRRMAQRAINQQLVSLVSKFGVEMPGGKVMLNRKALITVSQKLKALNQIVQKAFNKGGLIVVREGDTLITTYRLTSHNPVRRRSNAKRSCATRTKL